MGLVPRLFRRRDGALFPARPARVRLARRADHGRGAGDLRPDRPFHHAVSAGGGVPRDLVRAPLRPLARLRPLLRRSLLWRLHLWLASRAADHVAVGRTRRLVAGVFRFGDAGFADGLAVLAWRREMGAALGPYGRAAPGGCRAGAGGWLTAAPPCVLGNRQRHGRALP